MANGMNATLVADAFAAWEHGDYAPFFEMRRRRRHLDGDRVDRRLGHFQGNQGFVDAAVVPFHDALAGPTRPPSSTSRAATT